MSRFFFFKQKTAYELRISDWSSDVCSSDLADEAYRGLKPEILILIAGMVVIGIAMEVSGLADEASRMLIASVHGLSPLVALIVLYLITMVLTELLSNATVAVLITPIAVALAESLGEIGRAHV